MHERLRPGLCTPRWCYDLQFGDLPFRAWVQEPALVGLLVQQDLCITCVGTQAVQDQFLDSDLLLRLL